MWSWRCVPAHCPTYEAVLLQHDHGLHSHEMLGELWANSLEFSIWSLKSDGMYKDQFDHLGYRFLGYGSSPRMCTMWELVHGWLFLGPEDQTIRIRFLRQHYHLKEVTSTAREQYLFSYVTTYGATKQEKLTWTKRGNWYYLQCLLDALQWMEQDE